MKFSVPLPAFLVVSFSIVLASFIAGCTAAEATKAQATLNKVENATTQASGVAGAVGGVTTGPTQAVSLSIEQLLLLALVGEKAVGTYLIPLFTKLYTPAGTGLASNSPTLTPIPKPNT